MMDFVTAAQAAFGADRVRSNVVLAPLTTFRVGGPADWLIETRNSDEIVALLRLATASSVPATILGGGSNVLVGDRGIRGVVVKLGRGFRRVEWAGDGARAGAAVQLARLARAAVTRELAGLEYAEGIPGTVGGALFMNAGAYGGEMAGTVETVEGVTREGERMSFGREALAFGYRRAGLPSGVIVTAVRFALRREDAVALNGRMDGVRARRTASQPQGKASAGSIFKNPSRDHAGRLIEAAGLKGARIGRARISERHANFIVNEGGAYAEDVKALMDLAQRAVWERSGVWLEPEVQLIGSW